MPDTTKALLVELSSRIYAKIGIQDLQPISFMPKFFVKGGTAQKSQLHHRDYPATFAKVEQVTIPDFTHDHAQATNRDMFNSRIVKFLDKNQFYMHNWLGMMLTCNIFQNHVVSFGVDKT